MFIIFRNTMRPKQATNGWRMTYANISAAMQHCVCNARIGIVATWRQMHALLPILRAGCDFYSFNLFLVIFRFVCIFCKYSLFTFVLLYFEARLNTFHCSKRLTAPVNHAFAHCKSFRVAAPNYMSLLVATVTLHRWVVAASNFHIVSLFCFFGLIRIFELPQYAYSHCRQAHPLVTIPPLQPCNMTQLLQKLK